MNLIYRLQLKLFAIEKIHIFLIKSVSEMVFFVFTQNGFHLDFSEKILCYR